jgi:cytochrome c biogenesis protein CcmG, thiol:disulfide interchange protein DsbE
MRPTMNTLCRVAALAIAAAATGALAEADIKPWKGKSTLPLVRPDLEGNAVDLKAKRGRALLVNFWATWCEPCRDEMPSLQRLRAKLAGKPFEVITVNFGESREKIAQFLGKEDLTLPVLVDTQKEAAKDWGVGGLPMTFLVDARGRVRYSVFGERDWSEGAALALVEKLVAEAPNARH